MTEEATLITRAAEGDRDAFHRLVDLHGPRLYALAHDLTGHREDAEDLVQETFIKAYRSLKAFRGSARFSSWLYRIAVNTWIDRYRKKRWDRVSPDPDQAGDPMDRLPSKDPGPDRKAEGVLIGQSIRNALDRLPPREKSVFVLRHDHDMPLAQIADILGIRTGSVKRSLYDAVRHLRNDLSEWITE